MAPTRDPMEMFQAELNYLREEMAANKKEIGQLKNEVSGLKKENTNLRDFIYEVEANLDELEQYSRKDCLILSGDGIPKEQKEETPMQTREIAQKIITETLQVKMQGKISACHRLKKRDRVLVKFADHEDKNQVYQAKFGQRAVVIHENLTRKRSMCLGKLSSLWQNKQVKNYHTRNGTIYARDNATKRYAVIQPWYSVDEILDTLQKAPALPSKGGNNNPMPHAPQQERMLITQSLEHIPAGHVLNQATNIEELIQPPRRSPRDHQTEGNQVV